MTTKKMQSAHDVNNLKRKLQDIYTRWQILQIILFNSFSNIKYNIIK